MNRELIVTVFSTPISYGEGLRIQQERHARIADSPSSRGELLLLQHTPVYTLGRSTKPEHLPYSEEWIRKQTGAEVVVVDRGGSVTYHGPGQLTAYLLLHLKEWDITIHQHLWSLEDAVIRTLNTFDIESHRVDGMTGVWTSPGAHESKVCAIGVACRRWVTYHGMSLNISTDLSAYEPIDPCGLGRPVTNMAHLLGKVPSWQLVLDSFSESLGVVLDARIVSV